MNKPIVLILSLIVILIFNVSFYGCKKSNVNSTGFVALNIPDTLTGFKAIIGGTFTMGSPKTEVGRSDDEVQHTVNISSFYISKTEVSVKEYRNFCNAIGLTMPIQPSYSKDNPQ